MRLRRTGAKVIWLGYLRSPGFGSPIEGCKDEGDELEARIARMAGLVDGIYFVSNADLVPHGDTSFHGLDRIHPSPKGAQAIAARAADFIRRVN
jgi:lysophospholipase L1-like esterase